MGAWGSGKIGHIVLNNKHFLETTGHILIILIKMVNQRYRYYRMETHLSLNHYFDEIGHNDN